MPTVPDTLNCEIFKITCLLLSLNPVFILTFKMFLLMRMLTDILLEVVPVEVEDQVVNKVVSVTDDDERQLVRQLCLLQEVLHPAKSAALKDFFQNSHRFLRLTLFEAFLAA
jgi:hypothetical protein